MVKEGPVNLDMPIHTGGDLRSIIKSFPDAPGVYLMKDADGEVIYVGKAVSLKKRVVSYFLRTRNSIKTGVMMSYVKDIRYVRTPSEYDALVLESKLIKQYKPRFNISLKDDKGFPYIKITHQEFPRVLIGRVKKEFEAADFFGPYTSAGLLRRALNILRKSFPFCACRRFGSKTCLNYDIKLCAGPCQGKISKRAYLRIIKNLEDFLSKKDSQVIGDISARMRRCSQKREYEKAARLRDQLEALGILICLKKIDAKNVFKISDDLEKIGLKKEPSRIEAFDVSNIGADFSVGAMVSFFDGRPDKKNYRRFKIRAVKGINDYAMMKEIVLRRYRRLLRDSACLPDLIVIDGGPGHLETARQALGSLEIKIPMIAIAKKEELIYTISRKEPSKFERHSCVLRLIQSVRDEAHRFALSYHRLLRKKHVFTNG